MHGKIKRREFIGTVAAASVSLGLGNKLHASEGPSCQGMKRVGVIGLDTSHSVAFTKALNGPSPDPSFRGYRVVAAYPKGSNDIESSVSRIPGYTDEVRKLGVEITGSINELLDKVDHVLLETNDGRLHLQQALEVMKAGKRMFIDKPVAASLSDAIAIYEAARHYNNPVFSSSSLRYIAGVKEIAEGSVGKVFGADTYSPATIEKTHPALFWYGVHGVETLFTVMGRGCITVTGTFTDNFDSVAGKWNDGRIGTFRGIRSGKSDFGGTVFGEKGISVLGRYGGYNPLLLKIVEFFDTGIPPVNPEETLEIFAFMAAAEESKKRGGATVEMVNVMEKAKKKAMKIKFI